MLGWHLQALDLPDPWQIGDDLDLLDAELLGEAFGDNLLAAYAAAGTPSLPDVRAGKATIRKGMKGDPVRYIQQRAGLSDQDVDGIFGDKTEAAVKRIQVNLDLGADGVVDRATLVALDALTPYRIDEKAPTGPGSAPVSAADKQRNQIIAAVLALLAAVGIGVAVTHR